MKTLKQKNIKTNESGYDPTAIESKWQEVWLKEGIYQPDLKNAPKPFFNLMMFPYPSAEGLHIGNMYAFTGADIFGRFKRMQGFNVFEPIGLDGFGIHSENYAIKVGEHPKKVAARTEVNFYRQLKASGNAYAWKNTVETYNPNYYKWTQWLFIHMFKAGLAYKKGAPVNFCPSCKTVLADEQAASGACERCNSIVEVKKLKQWFFKITAYAQKLLDNLKKINWPQKVLLGQKNWIGESRGAEIIFKIEGKDEAIKVFTTRVDTIYGVTAIVIAPDKVGNDGKTPLGVEIASKECKSKVEDYLNQIKNLKLKIKNSEEDFDKTGVFAGTYAINPFSGEKIPVWVANYVVGWYGTGALMVVPAHDERDFQFAKKYKLPIKPVIKTKEKDLPTVLYGVLIDSGEFTGLSSEEAISKMIDFLKDTNCGGAYTQYKLRDWIISRQRYWGAPIPMIFCETCAKNQVKGNNAGWFPVPEDQLPILLPEVKDWRPKGTGQSPLASVDEFVYTTCPNCGGPAKRETDVCDTFLDSSWYYLRYPSVGMQNSKCKIQNDNSKIKNELELPWNEEITKKWLPVSQYTGGAEHTVLHLLYSRFVTMALHDMGYLDFNEPFPNFFAHGLIIREGAKMSKSKGNIVVPDEYIKKYGVDSLRCYLMFLGPFDAGGDFRDSGIHGMSKFLKRIWKLANDPQKRAASSTPELKIALHKTIKKVTEDIVKFKYNTSLAFLMEFTNSWECKVQNLAWVDLIAFLKLLAPFAPHMTEEIFQKLKIKNEKLKIKEDFQSIHQESWPTFDESLLVEEKVTIIVQINGKLRAQLEVSRDFAHEREHIIEAALKNESVTKYIKDPLQAKKIIFVPGRLINFVV